MHFRVLVLVLAAGPLISCTSPSSKARPIPAQTQVHVALEPSPAGRALTHWLKAYNAGRTDSMEAAIARLYSPAALERRSATDRAIGLRLWWRNYGPLTPVRVDSLSGTAAVVTVREGLTDGWGTLYIDVDSVPPHPVTGIAMLPFREPLDWREDAVRNDAALVAEVERLADRLVQADAFSGVVLLSREGRPLLRRAFGFADREARRLNMIDTPFELASTSKMFTAVAVAQLADQGRLSLDATIGDLLPNYPPGECSAQVTVHHLLTMSSGITDLFRSPRYWAARTRIRTLSDYWEFFATRPLEFPPGTQWSYSNSNFLVLGAIVEQITGEPFIRVTERQVFGRAGMTRTTYRSGTTPGRAQSYSHMPPGSAPGATPDPDQWYPVGGEAGTVDDNGMGSSAGGGVSTVDDLARFAQALMRRELLSQEMTTRFMTGYLPTEYDGRHGYGLETRVWNGVRVLGHGGAFTGVSTQVDFYPDLGYVLVVLGNSDASGAQAIANRVRALVAGSPDLARGR